MVSLKKAAELAGVSMSTAKRRRPELRQAGATQDNAGRWHIPITAVDVLKGRPHVDPLADPPGDPLLDLPNAPVADAIHEALADAQREAAVWRARAEERAAALARADQRLDELMRENLANAARLAQLEAMRQVTAGDTVNPDPPNTGPTPNPKPGFWSRLFGR